MLLGNDRVGVTRTPRETGERGTCPGCGDRVDSVVGLLVIPHWRHFAHGECDPWSGGETDWHLRWKTDALETGKYRIEVPFEGPPRHLADAVSRRGHILEFQHSGLAVPDLEERSAFYGRHGVLGWVIDGEVRRWRSSYWAWRKGRAVLPDGVGFIALDEIGRRLQARES